MEGKEEGLEEVRGRGQSVKWLPVGRDRCVSRRNKDGLLGTLEIYGHKFERTHWSV